MLQIAYESEGFPAGTATNGLAELPVTWDDVLWAAATVGRPNRHYVFRHGDASIYEALFRWSLVRMALEQSGPGGYRLRRTNAAKTLDPSEKGAVSYFLGMTFCKLFADKLLKTPWLLHLDVFRPALDPLLIGGSRPDLVGEEQGTGRWHAFECKGRSSPPGAETKAKAKVQAQRLASVNGIPCGLHIGAITYFRGDVLHFYWRDPRPEVTNVEVPFSPDAWRFYYAPVIEVMRRVAQPPVEPDSRGLGRVAGLDIQVGVHPAVARLLFSEQWATAQRVAVEAAPEFAETGYQPDGLLVRAGESWHRRFREQDAGAE